MSPSLVVWLDHVRANVARIREQLGGDLNRWRPHVKTTKIPEVFAELVRAGVRQFKCATTREAEHLARVLEAESVREADVLLAYPLIGPGLARLGEVAAGHASVRFSVLCEDPALVPAIPNTVGIFVDVNPGMNRTGVPLVDAARITAIARAAGVRFRGLHYYDGHLHDADLESRRRQIFAGYDALLDLRTQLAAADLSVAEIITAGTPAFLTALAYEPLAALQDAQHRVSPGTVVYHDARSEEENPGLALQPAALVFARVISKPAPGIVTCDAGSKSVAAEAGDPCAVVLGRPELVARTPNEEHLPFDVTAGVEPERGDELLLIPRHVCPTVNLAEEAVLIENGQVRGIVPVAARAHEVR
ncbi:MAG: D-TA family PLP-dependent enzyme [bacterium]|nr:D-TA family PLP-dependent enzyme [bacterium]